jgi:2-phosphosulfolactate phosphatase
MQIERVDQPRASQARGVVIVIDVIRAFTVAAYAFAGGAQCMLLVRTVEEAHTLRSHIPRALLVGEVGGRLIPGFDFNNSPSLIAATNVRGRTLIQRTGAGTQGAVNAINATHILLSSLTNAQASAVYARTLAASSAGIITLLPTATSEKDLYPNEDDVCAGYIEALLRQPLKAPSVLAEGINYLHAIDRFQRFEPDSFDFPTADIPMILAADCFDFAMVGTHKQWGDIDYVEVQRVDVGLKML